MNRSPAFALKRLQTGKCYIYNFLQKKLTLISKKMINNTTQIVIDPPDEMEPQGAWKSYNRMESEY
jgi:hypothetical protein